MPAAIRLPVGIRYVFVGGTCLVLNNLILIVADGLSQPLLVGVGIGFFVVGSIGFRLHCRFTFETAPTWLGLARYLGAMAANTPLSVAFLWIFSVFLVWPMPIAAPVASVGMIVINFLTSRLAIQGRRVRRPAPIAGERQAC